MNKPQATRKFAVFDFDGTLIRWQLYHSVVDKLAKMGVIDQKDFQKMSNARMRWKNRSSDNAFHEYEQTVVPIYEKALKSIGPKDFDRTVDEVFSQYKDQVNTYTRRLLTKLKREGYFLIAISGSHQEIVEKIARYHGFDVWLGTIYEKVNGRFSGKISAYPAGAKDKSLRKIIKDYGLSSEGSIAIGDSASDIPMLEMAERPIVFNPTRELLEQAKKDDWKIVIERKSVVYELDSEDGRYLLA